jgi:ribulose-5-phosphate 4-epimerase/fuculose-1-phosphate aldolase
MNDLELEALRRRVALSCRILAMTGLMRETTGHVSTRIPGTNEMFIRGRGREERGLLFTSEQEVLRLDFDGNGMQRDLRVGAPQELPIHGEIYKARPDVGCVVHVHPPAILRCTIAGVRLRPIFGGYDPSAARLAIDGIPVFQRSITLTRPEDVLPMLQLMGDKSVCLMKGHGATITGLGVEDATVRAIKLENLAQIAWDVSARGMSAEISPEDQAVFARAGGAGASRWALPVWEYYADLARHERLGLDEVAGPP